MNDSRSAVRHTSETFVIRFSEIDTIARHLGIDFPIRAHKERDVDESVVDEGDVDESDVDKSDINESDVDIAGDALSVSRVFGGFDGCGFICQALGGGCVAAQ